jgi:hypothetical protein
MKDVDQSKEQRGDNELVGMLAPLTVQDLGHSLEQLPKYSYFY